MLTAFLTHAYRPDKRVKVLGRPRDTDKGYYYIEEEVTKKRYVVPDDQIEYREITVDDLL